MALGSAEIVLRCTIGTNSITKVSIKNSAIHLAQQVPPRGARAVEEGVRVKAKVGDQV